MQSPTDTVETVTAVDASEAPKHKPNRHLRRTFAGAVRRAKRQAKRAMVRKAKREAA